MADKTVFQPASGGVLVGTRLNGMYEIERLIAKGGMGEVYKGFNIQTGDPVAIKMIRPEMSGNPDALALFRREASTLHNLQHEAIVRYFVFSVDPDLQRAYLAMEFVDGPSLTDRLARGPLGVDEVRVLMARVAPALDAAHALGVIHRDISSDNFILPDGDVRKAKVIDFGIARSRRPNEGTIIGDGFAGKYNYVSPEQLGLAGGEVTAKSDIYSLGLVLAEALRGRPIDMGGSQVEIIEKRRKVPDLSDIPAAFQPLLQSMLQPDPADRPASLAALVSGDRGGGAPTPLNPDASAGGVGGKVLAAIAAVLIVASLAGVGYVFRDQALGWLKPAAPTPVATGAAIHTLPPPLGGETPTTTPESSASAPPSPTPTNMDSGVITPNPTPTSSKTPGLAELLDEMPPRAPLTLFTLPAATVGTPYRAAIPAFADPSHKGLTLQADSPPEGMSLQDRGDGSSELTGAPTRPGATTFVITATNRNGRSARMPATIAVGAVATTGSRPPIATPSATSPPPVAQPRAPTPSQSSVVLADAVAGRDYNAALPPFRGSPDARGLALHVEPNPPEGLTFADSGGGFSQLSGKPAQPGAFGFDVVAIDANGASGRMTIKLIVAPPPPPVANATSNHPAKGAALLTGYDGGGCFVARARDANGDPNSIDAVGADRAAFSRFEAAYKREVGVEPDIAAKLIVSAQCPAVALMKLSADAALASPTIELATLDVGAGHPLAGAVRGLAGRKLTLLVIDNDGDAHLLPSVIAPTGDAATFSVPLTGDAQSIGPLQMLLAIASDAPLPAFEHFRPEAVGDLAPKLLADWAKVGAVANVAFFKLTK